MQFGRFFNLVHGIHDNSTDRYEFLDVFLLHYFIDLALSAFQNRIQAFLAAVAGIGNLFVRTDQTSECRLFRNNPCIILDICRGRNRRDQIG